jgi:hypothetical protein
MRSLLLALTLVGACGDDSGDPPGQPDARQNSDAATGADAPPGGPDASCFMNPTTSVELLNACTTAQKIDKDDSDLPLLNADGTLPPLSTCNMP